MIKLLISVVFGLLTVATPALTAERECPLDLRKGFIADARTGHLVATAAYVDFVSGDFAGIDLNGTPFSGRAINMRCAPNSVAFELVFSCRMGGLLADRLCQERVAVVFR